MYFVKLKIYYSEKLMEIPDIFSSIHLPLYYFINNIKHLLL